jgi:hypothetical protein
MPMIRAPNRSAIFSGHPEAGIVGAIQRQTDHDGFIVHTLLHASGDTPYAVCPHQRHPRRPSRFEADLDQESPSEFAAPAIVHEGHIHVPTV